MAEGSPVLRSILWRVFHEDMFLLPRKKGKLVILEDVPLFAMFYEWALNIAGVETAVFHSGLDFKARFDLQAEFNDPTKSLSVLIVMYDVGGTGLNLWHDS